MLFFRGAIPQLFRPAICPDHKPAIRGGARENATDIYLAGLRRAEREDPIVHGGDESGALCPNTKNHKSDKGTNDLLTCTAQ